MREVRLGSYLPTTPWRKRKRQRKSPSYHHLALFPIPSHLYRGIYLSLTTGCIGLAKKQTEGKGAHRGEGGHLVFLKPSQSAVVGMGLARSFSTLSYSFRVECPLRKASCK